MNNPQLSQALNDLQSEVKDLGRAVVAQLNELRTETQAAREQTAAIGDAPKAGGKV